MPKYQCPKCQAILTQATRFCPSCGVELLPPKSEQMPKVEVILEEEPVSAPAPQPAPVQQQPAPQPAPQSQPAQGSQPFVYTTSANYGGVVYDAETVKEEENKNKVKPRSIVGFCLAFIAFLGLLFGIADVFMFGVTDITLRWLMGLAAGGVAFVFSIAGLATAGKLSETYKLKGFVIAAKVLGIISLIFCFAVMIFWGAIPLLLQFGNLLEGFLGFNIGEYIRGFLLGQFLL